MSATQRGKYDEKYPSITHELLTGCGKMYIHQMYKDGTYEKLVMIKVSFGKAGGCPASHLESKSAFLNGLLKNVNTGTTIKILTDACGHRCREQDLTCHDILFKHIIDVLMKEKIT